MKKTPRVSVAVRPEHLKTSVGVNDSKTRVSSKISTAQARSSMRLS
jgi:hypothetical protein